MHLEDAAIDRYVRGRSPRSEISEIEGHADGCATCGARVMEARTALDGTVRSSLSPVCDLPEAARTWGLVDFTTAAAPDDEGARLERGATLGRYLVLDRLGEGGMGVVYAAYDPELDRKVAVKLLRAEGKTKKGTSPQARLLREAQAMARVSHPNVVSVYDVGTLGGRVFVAMEFVDGVTLTKWLRQQPRTWREVLAMFVQAGRGLAAAHAAGLVHRDFKPENVLIGSDGRARVTDFGLARLNATTEDIPAIDGSGPSTSPGSERLSSPLTLVGEVMGTPAYMAPEQHVGRASDMRSDQFSFCAALYWAVYKKRPFEPLKMLAVVADELEGDHVTQLDRDRHKRADAQTLIQEPPRDTKVPAWLKKAIFRGLSLEPSDRFASMEELLARLTVDPLARRRRWIAAGVAVALAAVGGLVWQQTRHQGQLCRGAERKLAGVWDPQVQQAIETAVLATGRPYAKTSWAKARELLDQYAQGWVAMHTDACEATALRGEQPAQVLSLRMICLDRKLKEMGALTAILAKADVATVDKLVEAAHALPSLRQCADVEALTAQVSPPDDPAARAEIERVGSVLAEAKALNDAGKFRQALAIARQAAVSAEKTRYRPIEAETLLLQGWLQSKTGDPQGGEETLMHAVWAAEAGRHDTIKTEATIRLIYNVGYQQQRYRDAEHWDQLARSSIERLGRNEELEMDLMMNFASVLVLAGEHEKAREAYESAWSRADRLLNKDHPSRSILLTNMGVVYSRLGDPARAEKALLESLALIERTRGPEHPLAGYSHNNLADHYMRVRDYEKALVHVQRAIAIWEPALGKEHPLVGDANDTMGTILSEQGRFADALVHYQRSLELHSKALGADHPDLAYSLDGVGQAYLGMGQAKAAIPYLERALKLRSKDPAGLAETSFGLARALVALHKDAPRARALALQAREGFSKAGNKEQLAKVETWLAAHRR